MCIFSFSTSFPSPKLTFEFVSRSCVHIDTVWLWQNAIGKTCEPAHGMGGGGGTAWGCLHDGCVQSPHSIHSPRCGARRKAFFQFYGEQFLGRKFALFKFSERGARPHCDASASQCKALGWGAVPVGTCADGRDVPTELLGRPMARAHLASSPPHGACYCIARVRVGTFRG